MILETQRKACGSSQEKQGPESLGLLAFVWSVISAPPGPSVCLLPITGRGGFPVAQGTGNMAAHSFQALCLESSHRREISFSTSVLVLVPIEEMCLSQVGAVVPLD